MRVLQLKVSLRRCQQKADGNNEVAKLFHPFRIISRWLTPVIDYVY